MLSTLLLLAALALPPTSSPQDAASRDVAQSDTDRAPLLDGRRLRQAMSRLASEHPTLVSLLNVGESRGAQKIEALRIASGEISQGRPAVLVVANIDGPLVYTSGIAFEHARHLAEAYGHDERVTQLLETTTIYIIPRANPDAASGYFASPRRELHASGHGVDNDRDGRLGEDDGDDLNKDGFISMMRVPDPDGRWTEDPTDARTLIEADASRGQRGKWKVVLEGRDDDEDGAASEDPVHDAVVNRNFAQDWEQHASDAGLFPTDEPEVRGLCEFVLTHKDIQLVLTYGELDNMVEKIKPVDDDAPAKKRVPASGVRASDARFYETLGELYRDLTKNKSKGGGTRGGSFQEWCYAQRGLFSLEISPWAIPLEEKPRKDGESSSAPDAEADDAEPDDTEANVDDSAGPEPEAQTKSADKKDKPSDDAKRLTWLEANGEASRHLGWTPFEHPELGAVDIGGFAPFALVDPPGTVRADLAAKELEFLLAVSEKLARITLSDVHARSLGGGLLEVEATVVNEGFLPVLSTWGRETKTTRPALVKLHLPDGAQLLAGKAQTLIGDLTGSGGHEELRWLVRGARAGAIGIRVETDHAGAVRAVPEVQK